LRNQAFLLAACAAVVIGCGGGGGGGHRSTTSSTTGTPASGMTVNLDPSFGRVEVDYLTGPGRAFGDTYLEITRQTISDGGTPLQRESLSPLALRLSGYQTLTARINVPFTLTSGGRQDSRNFTQLDFDPNRVLVEDSSGGLKDGDALPDTLPVTLDSRIRAFPGRTTIVQLRVSSASFIVDPVTGAYSFDTDEFKEQNYQTSGIDPEAENKLGSRLSDFVRFSLKNVPVDERPDLRVGYDDADIVPNGAQYVYFSGDNTALSNNAAGSGSVFQEVGNVFTDVALGKWSEGTTAGFKGTYDLRDILPPDISGTQQIVSIYGNFNDYNTVLTGGGTFEMVMFPNSGETYTFEGDDSTLLRGKLGDVVAFVRTGTNITKMYFGAVDLGKGTFELFPIKGLGADPADPDIQAARITGTVANYVNASGGVTTNLPSIRKFAFTFDAGTTLPTGFVNTGTVTVFRK